MAVVGNFNIRERIFTGKRKHIKGGELTFGDLLHSSKTTENRLN